MAKDVTKIHRAPEQKGMEMESAIKSIVKSSNN